MKYLHVKLVILCLSLTLGLQAAPIKLSGVVSSDNEKSISSRYMGFVKAVYVEEGATVKKGDVLYEIDSTLLLKSLQTKNFGAWQLETKSEMDNYCHTHSF